MENRGDVRRGNILPSGYTLTHRGNLQSKIRTSSSETKPSSNFFRFGECVQHKRTTCIGTGRTNDYRPNNNHGVTCGATWEDLRRVDDTRNV